MTMDTQNAEPQVVTAVFVVGIFLLMFVLALFVIGNRIADDQRDAINRCVEANGGGDLMRVYCTQVYSE